GGVVLLSTRAGEAARLNGPRKSLISGGGRVLPRFMQRQGTGPGLVERDTAAVAAGRERYLDTGRAMPTPSGECSCAGCEDRHAALSGRLSRFRRAAHSAAAVAGTTPSRNAT